jgi:hypothetical protein
VYDATSLREVVSPPVRATTDVPTGSNVTSSLYVEHAAIAPPMHLEGPLATYLAQRLR